jgi:hypothetical protein
MGLLGVVLVTTVYAGGGGAYAGGGWTGEAGVVEVAEAADDG